MGAAARPDDPIVIGVAVPEPATALLVAAGLVLLGRRRGPHGQA